CIDRLLPGRLAADEALPGHVAHDALRGDQLMRRPIRVLLLSSTLAACNVDHLLDVHEPGRVPVEALNDPTLAVTLANGVIGDLECAWSAYSAGAAMISDQFIQASGNLNQRNWGSRRITADDASY